MCQPVFISACVNGEMDVALTHQQFIPLSVVSTVVCVILRKTFDHLFRKVSNTSIRLDRKSTKTASCIRKSQLIQDVLMSDSKLEHFIPLILQANTS